ncbi:calcium-dependent secretion activator-like isoform X1 [Scylla paramamosain]|uniref:calcium-dependent secretion activator-like isoform X1 n=1 Tax=Scylla paramamosain TaxID=85552 RepID=UPI0030828E57
MEEKLNTKTYQTISQRMATEEAACALLEGSRRDDEPDGVGTVLAEEKERFQHIKERLRVLLEHQITNFMYCFPFGRPEGALKATLSLLERVLMKDIVTPVPPEEVRGMIKKCLENAALLNYTRLSAETRIEGHSFRQASGGYLASTTGSTFLGGSESDGDEGFLQGDGKEMQASFKRKYMYSSKREGILSRSEKVYSLN